MSESCKVSIAFQGREQSYQLRKGMGLLALSVREKTPIEYDCKKADCGICIVRVLAGNENLNSPTPQEADFLKAMHADHDERLSCQVRVFGDVKLAVEFA
jgi:ferredoxin